MNVWDALMMLLVGGSVGVVIGWWLAQPKVYSYSYPPVELIGTKTETGWTFTETGFNLGPGESCEVKMGSNGRVTRHD